MDPKDALHTGDTPDLDGTNWFAHHFENTVRDILGQGGLDDETIMITDTDYDDGKLFIKAIPVPSDWQSVAAAAAILTYIHTGRRGGFNETIYEGKRISVADADNVTNCDPEADLHVEVEGDPDDPREDSVAFDLSEQAVSLIEAAAYFEPEAVDADRQTAGGQTGGER